MTGSIGRADISFLVGKDFVDGLAIICGDVPDIIYILQTAFYLERTHTGVNEFPDKVAPVHILERQEVAVLDEGLMTGILQVKGHAAELGTPPPVGTTPETILGGIATTAVADAQRTMDKHFQLHSGT